MQVVKDLKNLLFKFLQQVITKRIMGSQDVEASSYFARIARSNKMAKSVVKEDYWPLFPFQTQTRIIE